MKSTFCVWTEDGTTWHCNPMDGEDASKDLLSTIDGNPQSYVDYGGVVFTQQTCLWRLCASLLMGFR